MEKKIYIEDLPGRLAGKDEVELPKGTRIRFVFPHTPNGDYYMTVGFDEESGSLCVYKSNGYDDTFEIKPISSNKILIK